MNDQERAALQAWADNEKNVLEPRIEARMKAGVVNTDPEECPCERGYANCYGGEFGPCPYCSCPQCTKADGAP